MDELVNRAANLAGRYPRAAVVAEARRAIDHRRREILEGASADEPLEAVLATAIEALDRPSLRRVINATGVILHTNLGRAPLGRSDFGAGYSNLELDLATGKRGKRDSHVAGLLERLLGQPAIAVNNNAAAVYLALNELAAGQEVIVSRGELIEIGDGFRIPDIMLRSGAILREIGTTNRTHIEDYREAITGQTRLILRVHRSNFHMLGFTARPDLEELVTLGRERGIPVYEDLGSGCMVDLREYGIDEPLVTDSLRSGVDLVSFSGDKLLGGPQAGILAGRPEIVTRLRRNPMFRALRLDKVLHQLLGDTLRSLLLERWDRIPILGMIRQSADEVRARALRLAEKIPGARLEPGHSVLGGGSTPEQSIPTWLVAIETPNAQSMLDKLRRWTPPVIGRIANDRLLLDLRTVLPDEEADLAAGLQALS